MVLHPNSSNPLHRSPVECVFQGGYFYAVNGNPADGPDYYWRDVFMFNDGFTTEVSQ